MHFKVPSESLLREEGTRDKVALIELSVVARARRGSARLQLRIASLDGARSDSMKLEMPRQIAAHFQEFLGVCAIFLMVGFPPNSWLCLPILFFGQALERVVSATGVGKVTRESGSAA